uniref:Zinc finger protein 512B n=1 Tax=Xenopus tropicalis TaxID=8364 RepID=A0A803K615_XENTR
MTDPIGSRRHFPRSSKSRAFSLTPPRAQYSGGAPASAPVHSTHKGSDQRRFPKQENRTLRGIPVALISQWKEKFKTLGRVRCPSSGCWLEFPSIYGLKHHYQRCNGASVPPPCPFPCPECDAAFASKLQLQKHLGQNHSDKDRAEGKAPTPSAISRLEKSPTVSGGKSRPQRFPKKPKVAPSTKNGEIGPPGRKQRDPCLSDEDPERMRHRRKQKTPRKFTGEQPSLSGTFGLKGLAKAEERGRRRRGAKPPLDEPRRRTDCAKANQEQTAPPPPDSAEGRCQRQRGEVLCPNCKSVTRKTMTGLRKHMEVCEQTPGPQGAPLDEQKERERLRNVLKQMGKLRCPNQGCSATFSSLMGYQYHRQRCGKEQCDWAKPSFPCPDCSRQYQSKAGRDYHVRSEHGTESALPEAPEQDVVVGDFERTPSGRVRRQSAQVAIFHLQEIAEEELAKDGGRRKMKEDLVPDTKRLNYLRPGLPTFHPQLLLSWKNRVKEHGFICCPNNCCEAVYSSVSGLKAHLANCTKGSHSVGKYRCLLCHKEFSSESGVKYHILKSHSQNWFRFSSLPSMHKRKVPGGPRNEEEAVGTPKKRRRKEGPPTKAAACGTGKPPRERKTPPKKRSSNLGVRPFSPSSKGTARMGGPSRGVK